jgi:hypothetical protein
VGKSCNNLASISGCESQTQSLWANDDERQAPRYNALSPEIAGTCSYVIKNSSDVTVASDNDIGTGGAISWTPTVANGLGNYTLTVTNTMPSQYGGASASSPAIELRVIAPTPDGSANQLEDEIYTQGATAAPLHATSGSSAACVAGELYYDWRDFEDASFDPNSNWDRWSKGGEDIESFGTDQESFTPPTNEVGTKYYYARIQCRINGQLAGAIFTNAVKITVTAAGACAYQPSWCDNIAFENVIQIPSGSYDNNAVGGIVNYNAAQSLFVKSYENLTFGNGTIKTTALDGGVYLCKPSGVYWSITNAVTGTPSCSP